MSDDRRFSSAFKAKLDAAQRAYHLESPMAGLALLDVCLATTEMSDGEKDYLLEAKSYWEKVADPDYLPPPGPTSDEIGPLFSKYYQALFRDDFAGSLKYILQYIGYVKFGTQYFQEALSHLTDAAASVGDFALAKCVAEMFLTHMKFIELTEISRKDVIPSEDEERDTQQDLPTQGALLGMKHSPEACWTTILERWLEQPKTLYHRGHYDEVFVVLMNYYKANEDTDAITRLSNLPEPIIVNRDGPIGE
ncbi:MAG: hypothetical protein JWN14_4367 [Chthonomonadales bacterium]|nr:hypothetical protein [Chthonomonadales bacterium]